MGRSRSSHHLDHEDEPQSTERVRQPRIIVADQDREIRHVVSRALRADGYMVFEASSGVDLLDHISTALLATRHNDKPDAIIMALWMPGISGLSILSGLRDAKWSTPILLLTGHLDRELRESYQRHGASAIFEKPFDVDDLRTVVLNLVPGATRRFDRHSLMPCSNDVFAATG